MLSELLMNDMIILLTAHGGAIQEMMPFRSKFQSLLSDSFLNLVYLTIYTARQNTRSSADADNGLDAFSGQSRSITMALFF